ncbi:nSTAND1 domain-containing NTPase [Citrobacter braakii]|uniref:nSTAND1 domain-containing NTPase n=1 Tax=Citrobacter TaxID=544 RepID=UPI0015E908BE|nr:MULTISPECIES: ATP-binding protein [Citrobacter]MDM2757839.1 ATP-binding protein [Citrobacter sp. Cpo148]QLY53004.1 ATP-binding protein [Citrobacter freundii]WFV07147.1 ATP-binding protein [Citrobacter freundii]
MNIFAAYAQEFTKKEDVHKYYTPSTPVSNPTHLKGRDVEVKSILDNLTVPGRHCMIYGDRGIGKSSLANATVLGGRQYNVLSGEYFNVKCDTNTKFKDIVSECAIFVSQNTEKYKEEKVIKAGLSAKFFSFFTGNVGYEEKIVIERDEITPRKAATTIGIVEGVLVIDEFDVLEDETKKSVAEFIKQLSDINSKLKILLVGISKDGKSLTAGHESVNRCLHEVSLSGVDDRHLMEIISLGEKGLGLTFENEVKKEIVDISNGFPYFTHLLCKEAAETAIGMSSKAITKDLFHKSIEKSVENAEGRLKREYEDAVRSAKTDVYKKILFSASKFKNSEFSVQQWISQIYQDTGDRYNNQSMSNYTGRLIKQEYGAVIKRLSRGVYKINDPRMPSYIRLANM